MDAIAFLLSNGRSTEPGTLWNPGPSVKPTACASSSHPALGTSNYWASTENSATNAWNVNFSSGNVNNNNKNNSNAVRAVAALDEETKEGWVAAFHDCCHKKKSSPNCNEYRSGDWELDLWLLVAEVYERRYTPKTSVCFIVTRPTYREIFAADFRDRITQHWICIRLEPLFEQRFREQGDKSHNCRKGFGTQAAVAALERDIREVSQDYTRDAWVAKIDIQSFFMSIDVEVLWRFLEAFIKERYKGDDIDTLLYLTEVTARHRPQLDCIRKSPLEFWEMLAPHKSLFTRPANIGVAIGNITSQQEANFYMSHYIEKIAPLVEEAGARIEQFVDDIPCVSPTKAFCRKFRKASREILQETLHQKIHPSKFYIQHVKKGINFVGQVIKPGRRYISNRTLGNFVSRLKQTEKLCRRILQEGPTERNLYYLRHAASSLNSYLGFMVHTSSYRMRRKIFKRECQAFWKIFYTQEFRVCKIKKRYDYRNFLITKEIKEYGMDLRTDRPRAGRSKNDARTKAENPRLQHRRTSRDRRKRLPVPVSERDPRAGNLDQGRNHRSDSSRAIQPGCGGGNRQQLPGQSGERGSNQGNGRDAGMENQRQGAGRDFHAHREKCAKLHPSRLSQTQPEGLPL